MQPTTTFRGKNLLLSIIILFLFTIFIVIIVATAGSTANYKPLTNIYIGDADISHINVTKIIPAVGPILVIMGTALTAPNSSLDEIFGSLKEIADTPALTPLLTLLSNAEDVENSIIALSDLAPLALSGNPVSDTKELTEISGLLSVSNNDTGTLTGLSELVLPAMAHLNSSSSSSASDDSTTIVMTLLNDSIDPLNSTISLKYLNGLTPDDKVMMLPVFRIFGSSDNITMTLQSLEGIMNADPPIPPQLASTLLTTIQSGLERSDNLTAVLSSIGSLVPDAQRSSFNSVGQLLNASSSPNNTLSILSDLIEENITESQVAKNSFGELTSLMMNSNNKSMVVQSVQSLAMVPNTTEADMQLDALTTMLRSTDNQNATVDTLATLSSGLSPNSSTFEYIPSLFQLLGASKEPGESFSSLVTLTAWAQQNPETFTPIVAILNSAESVEQISEEALTVMTPTLLEFLKIPIHFRLSIFSLCKANLKNEIIECSSPHAVQNMDFRHIVYDALMDSDFEPYLRALNITADSLQLDGRLQDREHEYVPSIKAVLAMNLLAIITSFFTMIFLFLLIFLRRFIVHKTMWFCSLVLVLFVGLFTGLGATICQVVVSIIKSGTHHDRYGVVFSAGSAYFGCVWTAFALAVVSNFIMLYIVWNMAEALLGRTFFRKRTSTRTDIEQGDGEEDEEYDEEIPSRVVVDDDAIVRTGKKDDVENASNGSSGSRSGIEAEEKLPPTTNVMTATTAVSGAERASDSASNEEEIVNEKNVNAYD
ncbi:Fat3p NDAI_0D04600 [Naumovozyma dairenensis CBS 421]|uniref:Uncharacterized protein n=1 Tax=Naumovozyma dairenensis (strain ATCC 10597 / BCRC 20456 / CBS 421 / NBRC 0211 / NRRL Y-12639) TaxID=1071378 RepID=G0WAG2_NAUDC|nr:hypothetical protein NDAI_0D04600 [Naumovozyma dairenensis CBS 421]CCD24773.1 hypothetical protein NDAI_0D04600 [Naumovozyma dairenensis CBS 421]